MDHAEVQNIVSNIIKDRLNLEELLRNLTLDNLLRRVNPYYEVIIGACTPREMIQRVVQEYIVRSEKTSFGHVLEDVAVALAVCRGGNKSPARGIDIDQIQSDTRNLISVKSGSSWGNHQSHSGQKEEFKKAKSTIRESDKNSTINRVMGICYGKEITTENLDYADYKVAGQNFWYLLSGDKEMYIKVFDAFADARSILERKNIVEQHIDRLTESFTERFGDDVKFALKQALVDFSSNWSKTDLVNQIIDSSQNTVHSYMGAKTCEVKSRSASHKVMQKIL